ncbi:CBS domain-containing protein [Candidatus Leptofilum sp.]|uniref:CBS domain-containing protein n=1 Tax=Candidatus Leptofilum sp. TaxID=3241576 RepID=UPI003B5AA08D
MAEMGCLPRENREKDQETLGNGDWAQQRQSWCKMPSARQNIVTLSPSDACIAHPMHYNIPMRLILSHENADFDAVASQLAASKLTPDGVMILSRRLNRNVAQFLTLYWDAFRFVRPSDWRKRRVKDVLLVDTQSLNSVRGMVAQPTVHVIDHHTEETPPAAWTAQVEPVGATTTLLVEQLQAQGVALSPEEATLMLLGIYEDTGSLTYDTTTPRDVAAAAWLLEAGGILSVVRRFLNIPLSSGQQALYDDLHAAATWHEVRGQSLIVAGAVAPENFTDEIASITHRLRESLQPAGLVVLVQLDEDVQLVARSTTDAVDVAAVARSFGGGGHSRAAAARIKDRQLVDVQPEVVAALLQAVQPLVRVADLMSHGVQMVPPEMLVQEAAVLMQRFGYEGYPVVTEPAGELVGLLTRRAVDRAISHEMDSVPVARIMRKGSVTVRPSDGIDTVQQKMLSEKWGQIPVVAEDGHSTQPIGIVTRTDLLNHLFQPPSKQAASAANMRQRMLEMLPPALWQMVLAISETADALDLPLYFVGGLVRDLLLGKPPTDLDMVVEGDAIRLGQMLARQFGGEIRSHKRFGTAKWLLDEAVWGNVLQRDEQESRDIQSLISNHQLPPTIDFVTARTEFYTEPTALPEVSHGSIKLDLHRRDFALNTLAVRLDGAFLGQLLDFYGGQQDLVDGCIRVLHSLSFVDDPTRILRAVRLEQRLNFQIEPRTLELIKEALPLLDRVSGARLRHEIELTLQESDPIAPMVRLAALNVLGHILEGLVWLPETAVFFQRVPEFWQESPWAGWLADESPTFVYFALWLAALPEAVQQGAMKRLRVRKATKADVLACGRLRREWVTLPAALKPSEVVKLLRPYPVRVLLVGRILLEGQPAADLIEQFLAEWRGVRTAVTGNTLKQMGLKPGPQFGILLEKLLAAKLDGHVTTEAEELALLDELLE